MTFDGSGNPYATVTLLDQYGNYSDTSQRGQIVYNNPYGTLSNNQCVVNLSNSTINGGSVTRDGYNMRYFDISLSVTFQSTMNGVQGIYENYSSYSSTYGSYWTNGLIWSGQNFTVGSGQPITISVSPSSARVFATRSQQFTASVSGSTAGVNWSLQGAGSISSSGLYTAPSTIANDQTVTVSASLQGNSSISGSANATASAVRYTEPAPNVGSVYNNGVQVIFPNVLFCTGYDCRQVTCSSSYPNFSVAPSGTSIQSHGITVTAATTAQPGTATITCTVQPLQGVAPPGTGSTSASVSVTIMSLPPSVSSVVHYDSNYSAFVPGEGKVAVKITGQHFGTTCGSLSVSGGPGVSIDTSSGGVCGGGQNIIRWSENEIDAYFNIDSTASPGGYAVGVAAQLGTAQGRLDMEQRPTITISGPQGVPLGGTNTFSVQVSPSNNLVPIVLSLTTTSGSGSAIFSSGGTSKTIIRNSTITVQGTDVSSTANNMVLGSSIYAVPLSSTAQFSVVNVTITISSSVLPYPDDTAAATFLQTFVYGAGIQSSGGGSPSICGVGVELIGQVTPADYPGPITLRRSFASLSPPGEIYSASITAQGFFAGKGGSDDTSPPQLLATTVSTSGNIFDNDAPGVGLFTNQWPTRSRLNLVEYAVLGNYPGGPGSTLPNPPPPVVSAPFPWWAAVSCTGSNDGEGNPVVYYDPNVPGDNTAGPGTTQITWDLKVPQ